MRGILFTLASATPPLAPLRRRAGIWESFADPRGGVAVQFATVRGQRIGRVVSTGAAGTVLALLFGDGVGALHELPWEAAHAAHSGGYRSHR